MRSLDFVGRWKGTENFLVFVFIKVEGSALERLDKDLRGFELKGIGLLWFDALDGATVFDAEEEATIGTEFDRTISIFGVSGRSTSVNFLGVCGFVSEGVFPLGFGFGFGFKFGFKLGFGFELVLELFGGVFCVSNDESEDEVVMPLRGL